MTTGTSSELKTRPYGVPGKETFVYSSTAAVPYVLLILQRHTLASVVRRCVRLVRFGGRLCKPPVVHYKSMTIRAHGAVTGKLSQ